MNYLRHIFVLLFVFVSVSALWSQHANVIWNTPSRNSSESMPCGGGDIGMNIWVEEGDILFYLSRSGTFDENNCQLKQGRFRIRLFLVHSKMQRFPTGTEIERRVCRSIGRRHTDTVVGRCLSSGSPCGNHQRTTFADRSLL